MANFCYSPFVFLYLDDNLKWNVHPDAIKILQTIGYRLLKIVCISGPMRKGKSYLMNRLANKQSGFDVGSSINACTKGIWGWFIPADSTYLRDIIPDNTCDILLLDTEGMYDPDRRNSLIDSQLFVAGILLSSLLIYNTSNAIDEYAIDQLSFVSQLSILISSKQGSTQTFEHIFPSLLWVIRDFFLDLSAHDNSPTKYLHHCLKPLAHVSTFETEKKNRTRDAISKYFPSLEATTIAHPGVPPQDMMRVNELPYENLSLEFRRDCNQAVRIILSSVRPKLIRDPSSPTDCNSAINVTPESLLAYSFSICEAFNNDGIPKLDDMFTSVSNRACTEAIDRSKKFYNSQFEEVLNNLPYVGDVFVKDNLMINLNNFKQPMSEIELNNKIEIIQSETIKLFTTLALGPLLKPSREELENYMKTDFESFRQMNFLLSKNLANEIASILMRDLERQADSTIQSFDEYCQVQTKLLNVYRGMSDVIGPALDGVVVDFLGKLEQLREKMRLKFRLGEVEREKDIAAAKYAEEIARAKQEQQNSFEMLQRAHEEYAREKQFLQEELNQLTSRVTDMNKQAEDRENLYDTRIQSMMQQNKENLANLEKGLKAQFQQSMAESVSEYEKSIKSLELKISELANRPPPRPIYVYDDDDDDGWCIIL